MFSFLKKKLIPPIDIDYADIAVDFHAHWLPGVDDGCQTMEDSILVLSKFEQLGYKKVYTSPHIMGDRYVNDEHDLKERFDLFKTDQRIQSLNLELGLIAEYLLDEKFETKLKENNFLTIGDGHILVETSMNYEFPFVKDYLFELLKLGYKPILAHPERYRYIYNEIDYLERYEEYTINGIELQLNLFSLVGLFGENSQRIAENLIDSGFYSYICSDVHLPIQLKYFEAARKSIFLKKLIQSGSLKNHQFL